MDADLFYPLVGSTIEPGCGPLHIAVWQALVPHANCPSVGPMEILHLASRLLDGLAHLPLTAVAGRLLADDHHGLSGAGKVLQCLRFGVRLPLGVIAMLPALGRRKAAADLPLKSGRLLPFDVGVGVVATGDRPVPYRAVGGVMERMAGGRRTRLAPSPDNPEGSRTASEVLLEAAPTQETASSGSG